MSLGIVEVLLDKVSQIKLVSILAFYLWMFSVLSHEKSFSNLINNFPFDCAKIVPSIGQCGGLILLWNGNSLNLSMVFTHDHFLHCSVRNMTSGDIWFITFLYMVPQKGNYLLTFKPTNNEPWFMGDFNSILSLQEKLGGVPRTPRYMTG